VAALDWATWHLTNQPQTDMCRLPIRPSHLPRVAAVRSVTCHVIHATCHPSNGDTCHPSSGDTCHLRIGPTVRQKVQICLPSVTTRGCHVTCTDLPRVVCTDRTDCTINNFFACLTFQTKCDIEPIQSKYTTGIRKMRPIFVA
jgi:hypothetical protein